MMRDNPRANFGEKIEKQIFSIDVESNGLWGNPIAIGAIVYDKGGNEIDSFGLKLPDEFVTNNWVRENVLPNIQNMKTFNMIHIPCLFNNRADKEKTYYKFLEEFRNFYMKYKENFDVLYHMGHVVESNLFKEMKRLNLIGDFDAPYVPIEVSAYLQMAGEPADSVDKYVEKYKVLTEDYGSTHNPLYDCEVAYKSYRHILLNKKINKGVF